MQEFINIVKYEHIHALIQQRRFQEATALLEILIQFQPDHPRWYELRLIIASQNSKVDEYLIMGKPVVATYTAFMQSFLPWVYLATGADEYTTALDKAIAEANVPELISGRKEFAASHTWEASVHKIYESINTKDDA